MKSGGETSIQTEPLRVTMLGVFTAVCGRLEAVGEHSRESKATHFLQYLLAHRGQVIPQQTLIDVILDEEDALNPTNTIKTIAYRARKLLHSAGLPEMKYIRSRTGGYYFDREMPCVVDVEEFESCVKQAGETEDDEERLALLLRALELYGGDFLPRSVGCSWVTPLCVRYQTMFSQVVNQCTRLLLEQAQAERALAVAGKAVSLYPYDEGYHYLHISVLRELGRTKEALREYEEATSILYDELGISPSTELRELFFRITSDLKTNVRSVDDIFQEIVDAGEEGSVFFCNYHMFANVCRFTARRIERYGHSAYLVLCNLTTMDGETPDDNEVRTLAQAFHKAIRRSLRRSDIYTRYSSNQFLLLLMDITQENCKMVMGRCAVNFRRLAQRSNALLRYECISMAEGNALPKTDLTWKAKSKDV